MGFDVKKMAGDAAEAAKKAMEVEKEHVKNLYRSEDQKKAAFYFSSENDLSAKPKEKKGCFAKTGKGEEKPKQKGVPYFDDDTSSKGCFKKATSSHYMSDQEYDTVVRNMISKINFKEKGLEFLGVDESEVNEVDPIHFGGLFYDDDARMKLGDDYKYRTNKWQETWLFFSQNSVFAYQCTLETDGNSMLEKNYEYSYKDITAISVTNKKDEKIDANGQNFTESSKFTIIVPGDALSCSFSNNKEQINSIKAMRAYIRDKKNSK